MEQGLKLECFRKKFPFNINYGMADITIREWIEPKHKHGESIDWDVYLPTKNKNLQRGFVWTLQQKQELILSVLKGIQLPPIYVIRYEHNVYKIIDGKQRLSTLISFARNEFPIIYQNKEYYFKDLHDYAQSELVTHGAIKANIAYEYADKLISDDDKIAWFEQINFAGTPQDKAHLEYLKS